MLHLLKKKICDCDVSKGFYNNFRERQPTLCTKLCTGENHSWSSANHRWYAATVILAVNIRGGVEDTRLEAKAKDTKKIRGQGQRTAFSRTEPLEAKDRNARGQGQGPRTPAQVFSKKKGLQKIFSGDLQFIDVPRIFDWGKPST